MEKLDTGYYLYNCIYCNTSCQKINEYKELTCTVCSYICCTCDARFIVNPVHNFLLETRLYCFIKNEKYCAQFTYDDLSDENISGRFNLLKMTENFIDKIVISLNYYPDVTPQNITSKINTFLTFL